MAGIAKKMVVVVDDDFRVRESIESLVDSAGYAPVVFASAEEFLQSGALAVAACLITDVRMPGLDGMELHRRVRILRPELPVILSRPIMTRKPGAAPSIKAPSTFCTSRLTPRTCCEQFSRP